ncbi:MAG: amidohydrolase family protein, partial [Myxococcota bacterium]
QVMAARSRGLPVYAETCPQYLFLSEDDLRGTKEDPFLGARYVCSPPLRPAHHQAHLWRGLREHDLQVVSTDHCSFNMKGQKDMGKNDFSKIPNGMPSIETRMHLIYDAVANGLLSLNRFVEVTATAPAKLFGLYPKKGTLAPGADADVVVWDPKKPLRLDQKNLNMRADYSPYEGRTVAGSPSHVFSRGELVAENGRFVGKRGHGRFVKRATTTAP